MGELSAKLTERAITLKILTQSKSQALMPPLKVRLTTKAPVKGAF